MVTGNGSHSFLKPITELSETITELSENRSFGVGIHDVSGKGRGAARKPSKYALKTVENVDFLSSPT